jgi:hypothetical protein
MTVKITFNTEVTQEIFDGIIKAKEILAHDRVSDRPRQIANSLRRLSYFDAADWIEENQSTFYSILDNICEVEITN